MFMTIYEIISTSISIFTFIVLIKVFTANKKGSNESICNEVESINQKINKHKETINGLKIFIDKHEKDIDCLHNKIDGKFDKLDTKIDALTTKFEQIYGHINSINNLLQKLFEKN